MCKCDYGNCSQECATVPLCRCHIIPSPEVAEAIKTERKWWREQLRELGCNCEVSNRAHSACLRKAIKTLLSRRPV